MLLGVAPLLVQCGSTSSASHGSAGDSGADGAGDGGGDGATSSSSSGGDGAVPTACTPATSSQHVSYQVASANGSNVETLSYDVDAAWSRPPPKQAPWWEVYARASGCPFVSSADLRIGGDLTSPDGGVSLPTTALTWSISGNEYPQGLMDAALALTEYTDPMQGVGNYWLSERGTMTGMPIGADCYELDFNNVIFSKDPGVPTNLNQASGTFFATGKARVGTGCP